MHLPARLWPVCAGACEVYQSDRLHLSIVQGCVMLVRQARRQLRGQSSLRASPVRQSCWQPTEQQSAKRAKPACCIAPPPCVAFPSAFLGPVGRLRSQPRHAGKRCSAHSFQYSAFPPARMHSGAGREMMRAGAAAARKAGAAPAAATRFQARGRPTRWQLAGRIAASRSPGCDADARVDVGVGVGLAR